MLRALSLGSGSKGNCLLISAGDEAIAVDAGFSCRELFRRMENHHFDPEKLRAIVLTHEHNDHYCGCRVTAKKLGIPVYMSYGTYDFISKHYQAPEKVVLFHTGDSFQIGKFKIDSFPVSHDAADPAGFVVANGDLRFGIATDLGIFTGDVEKMLCDCNAIMLESNYDRQMLEHSDRRLELKRRIFSRIGHLGNLDTVAALPRIVGASTRFVMLAHVSEECNDTDIIRQDVESILRRHCGEKVVCDILSQNDENICREIGE